LSGRASLVRIRRNRQPQQLEGTGQLSPFFRPSFDEIELVEALERKAYRKGLVMGIATSVLFAFAVMCMCWLLLPPP
jgi:hypothetical protein